jgi:hypothetical protein
MVVHETVCLRRLAQGNHSEEIRHGRFLANQAVTVAAVIAGWSERTRLAVEGRHVLAVQDTSEIQFATTDGNRRGLGRIKKGNCHGILLHPMLALDAASGACLGLVSGEVWTRGEGELAPRLDRPLSERESQRWIATAEAAKPILEAAAMVTFIADRESDFYALWASLPEERYHALARVMHDHGLVEGSTLRRAVAATPMCDRGQSSCASEPAARPARRCLTCALATP